MSSPSPSSKQSQPPKDVASSTRPNNKNQTKEQRLASSPQQLYDTPPGLASLSSSSSVHNTSSSPSSHQIDVVNTPPEPASPGLPQRRASSVTVTSTEGGKRETPTTVSLSPAQIIEVAHQLLRVAAGGESRLADEPKTGQKLQNGPKQQKSSSSRRNVALDSLASVASVQQPLPAPTSSCAIPSLSAPLYRQLVVPPPAPHPDLFSPPPFNGPVPPPPPITTSTPTTIKSGKSPKRTSTSSSGTPSSSQQAATSVNWDTHRRQYCGADGSVSYELLHEGLKHVYYSL